MRAKRVRKKRKSLIIVTPRCRKRTTREKERGDDGYVKRRTRGGGVVRCFPRRSRSRLSRRRREIAGDRSRHDRASGAESEPPCGRASRTRREKNAAEGCIDPPAARSRRRCASRQATTRFPSRRFVSPLRRRHSQPQTTRSFRFDPPDSFSSLLSLVRTFRSTLAALRPAPTPARRPCTPATPFAARMSTMPLAAIYPNRANAQSP